MSDRNLSVLAIKAFVVAVVTLCACYMFFVVGPAAESKYWPVVGKLSLLNVRAQGDQSLVSVRFQKFRNCEYLGIAWHRLYPNGDIERVPVVLMRKSGDVSGPNRPVGVSIAGPWIVSMPVVQLRGQSIVEVFHRCHPFWTTRTPFYP